MEKQFKCIILSDWWFGTCFHILGMSSSQLTNSIIFQRGRSTTNQSYCTTVSAGVVCWGEMIHHLRILSQNRGAIAKHGDSWINRWFIYCVYIYIYVCVLSKYMYVCIYLYNVYMYNVCIYNVYVFIYTYACVWGIQIPCK